MLDSGFWGAEYTTKTTRGGRLRSEIKEAGPEARKEHKRITERADRGPPFWRTRSICLGKVSCFSRAIPFRL